MLAAKRIAEVISQFKRNWTECIDEQFLERACILSGCNWRERLLTPVRTIQLLLLQVLHGNAACSHLPHLAQTIFSAAAYCRARKRLPLAVLESVVESVGAGLQSEEFGESRWRGHRVLIGDGTHCSMSDTPELQRYFEQPCGQRKGCGFPVAHLLCLVHAGTGLLQRMLVSPLRTHDMSRVVELHPELQPDDVMVLDRAFCSFAHFSLLSLARLHGVIRMHQRRIVDFRSGRRHAKAGKKSHRDKSRSSRLRKLGKRDQLIEWHKPLKPPLRWMTDEQFDALPETCTLRELRYRVNRRGFRTDEVTIVTTLLDSEQYPKDAIAELYGLRWEIETNIKHLKITMGMDVLRCQTVDGILKELLAFHLVYNLVRLVMLEAAKHQGVPMQKISFIDALRWLRCAESGETLVDLVVNPHRPFRFEPRVRKRRPRNYPLMRKPRRILKNIMALQSLAA